MYAESIVERHTTDVPKVSSLAKLQTHELSVFTRRCRFPYRCFCGLCDCHNMEHNTQYSIRSEKGLFGFVRCKLGKIASSAAHKARVLRACMLVHNQQRARQVSTCAAASAKPQQPPQTQTQTVEPAAAAAAAAKLDCAPVVNVNLAVNRTQTTGEARQARVRFCDSAVATRAMHQYA